MREGIAAVLLAGGRGSRMGGIDKGLLRLAGESLAERAIRRISPHVDEILIVANRNLEYYSTLGRVFSDEGWGPLSGLRQGMLAAKCRFVLSLPCDTPFFPESLAQRLKASLVESSAQIAIPESEGKTHQAFMLCSRELASDLSVYLEGGGRRVAQWQMGLDCVAEPFPDEDAFFNVNTPEDLTLAESIFSGGRK